MIKKHFWLGLAMVWALVANPLDAAGPIVNSVLVTSGTYSPTLTIVANLDSVTTNVAQYLRVGSVVTVAGRLDIDPTADATTTSLGVSLPIPSNFASVECGGVLARQGALMSGGISADTVNDRANFQFISVGTASSVIYYTFTYQVL